MRAWLFKLFPSDRIANYDHSGEAKWLIMSRGIFAASLLVAAAGFALFNLVLAPVIESAMVPTKELRVEFTGSRVPPDIHFPGFIPVNVVVMVRDYPLTALCRNFDIHLFVLWMFFFRLKVSSYLLPSRPYKKQLVFGVSYHLTVGRCTCCLQ